MVRHCVLLGQSVSARVTWRVWCTTGMADGTWMSCARARAGGGCGVVVGELSGVLRCPARARAQERKAPRMETTTEISMFDAL